MERERPHPRSGRPGKGNAKHCLIMIQSVMVMIKGDDYCNDHDEYNDDGGGGDSQPIPTE